MILARHAEALFWAGRQLERAESTTRALDVVGRNAVHMRPGRAGSQWRAVLELFGVFDSPDPSATPEQATVTHRLFVDLDNPGSVAASVAQLRENVRTVRDRVPVELWEEANRLHLELRAPSMVGDLGRSSFEVFSSVRRGCQAMAGVAAEAMPRDETYTFFDVGRMLERCIVTTRIARIGLIGDSTGLDAAVLLRVASCLQAYRRDAGYADDPLRVAAFLLRAEQVPRSVLACLRRVDLRLELLQSLGPGVSPARQLCGRARSQLEFGDVLGDLSTDATSLLAELEGSLFALCEVIATYAFNPAHSPVLHAQFVRPGVEGP